jgi:hypothetical protein
MTRNHLGSYEAIAMAFTARHDIKAGDTLFEDLLVL